MRDRLNSLVRNDRSNYQWWLRIRTGGTPALASYCERVEYSSAYLCFASVNAPNNPVRLMVRKIRYVRCR